MLFIIIINPRRACAARVTVLGLRVGWGTIFSVKGEKGGKKGGKEGREGGERKRSWCNLKREIQISMNAVHEKR